MLAIMILVTIVFLAFINSLNKQALGILPHVPSASAKMYFLRFPNTSHIPSPALAPHMLFALPDVPFTLLICLANLLFEPQLIAQVLKDLPRPSRRGEKPLGLHMTKAVSLHNSSGGPVIETPLVVQRGSLARIAPVCLYHNFLSAFYCSDLFTC